MLYLEAVFAHETSLVKMDAEDERLNVGRTAIMATSEWHEKPDLVLPGKVHVGEQRLDKMF